MPKPKNDLERWTEEARALGPVTNPLRTPYDIALREAATAAEFIQKYWEAAPSHPGLSRVASRLPKATGEELQSLVRAVQAAQTELLLVVDPALSAHGDRARYLVDALESVIEFVLDDGVDEPADTQLAQVQEFHSQNGQRSSALSQALRDYAALAKSMQKRIVEVDAEFDTALIAEAEALAKTLAETGGAAAPAQSKEARDATLLRNQLLTLLTQRIARVRSAATYVFDGYPAIVREVMSAYQRHRRAAARRAKGAPPGTPPADPQPAPK